MGDKFRTYSTQEILKAFAVDSFRETMEQRISHGEFIFQTSNGPVAGSFLNGLPAIVDDATKVTALTEGTASDSLADKWVMTDEEIEKWVKESV